MFAYQGHHIIGTSLQALGATIGPLVEVLALSVPNASCTDREQSSAGYANGNNKSAETGENIV